MEARRVLELQLTAVTADRPDILYSFLGIWRRRYWYQEPRFRFLTGVPRELEAVEVLGGPEHLVLPRVVVVEVVEAEVPVESYSSLPELLSTMELSEQMVEMVETAETDTLQSQVAELAEAAEVAEAAAGFISLIIL